MVIIYILGKSFNLHIRSNVYSAFYQASLGSCCKNKHNNEPAVLNVRSLAASFKDINRGGCDNEYNNYVDSDYGDNVVVLAAMK